MLFIPLSLSSSMFFLVPSSIAACYMNKFHPPPAKELLFLFSFPPMLALRFLFFCLEFPLLTVFCSLNVFSALVVRVALRCHMPLLSPHPSSLPLTCSLTGGGKTVQIKCRSWAAAHHHTSSLKGWRQKRPPLRHPHVNAAAVLLNFLFDFYTRAVKL